MPQDLINALDLYRKDRKAADTGVPVDEETPEDDDILSSVCFVRWKPAKRALTFLPSELQGIC